MSTKVDKLRSALPRTNTFLLMVGVMVFQFVAMMLLVFRKEYQFQLQAAVLCLALPLATVLLTNFLANIWPIDRAFLILVMLLVSIGIITLTAVCRSDITPRTHAIYAAAGLPAMVFAILFVRRWRSWKSWTIPLAGLCILALLTPWVPVIGGWNNGARNWITIIPNRLTIQPSEFMKPVLIIVLASGFSNRPRFVKCLPTIGFAAVCCAILLAERDLGAVLLYFLTTVFMYYAATSNAFLTLSGLGMGCVAAVIAHNLLPYVQDRVAIWQNPWSDPQNTGYQLVQSLIAIGSGGLFGQGLGLGSPRNIPLYYSDFIFASMAEEFGLIFATCVLVVYVVIVLRGMIVAMNARSSFHSLTAFGLMIMLALQTMLIVGGNTKLIPLTGVTLPLVSYGGSSIVSTLISMGILLGISSMNAEEEDRDIEQLELREDAML